MRSVSEVLTESLLCLLSAEELLSFRIAARSILKCKITVPLLGGTFGDTEPQLVSAYPVPPPKRSTIAEHPGHCARCPIIRF